MPKFKELNLWGIYMIILIITISLASIIFFNEWKTNKNKYIEQISNINRITSQNTLSSLRNQESILNILGKNLLSINTYTYPEDGRKTIEDMITVNKGIVAFGLARFDGQLILVSTLKEGIKLPNLMKNNKTKKSFKIARTSSQMILGRTYFMKQLNKWVIPIRMGIENEDRDFPLVMTAGINADGGDTVLNVKELPKDVLIQVVRNDGYLQFQNPLMYKKYNEVYNKPFSKQVFNLISSMKSNEINFFDTNLSNEKTLTSSLYIKDFNLHILTSIPYRIINKEFYNKFYISLLVLFIILLALYFLFKYTINIQEISRKQLSYIAKHDTLTGLYNRYYLNEILEEKIVLGDDFYVLFLDVDNFKYVNDTFGHQFGDKLLKKISEKLKSITFVDDFVFRNGGDEFVLVVKENQKEAIRNLSNNILEIFTESINIQNNEIFTGLSIGISKFDDIKITASDLLNQADIALYKAKESKSSYVFFSKDISKYSKELLLIESELRQAIQNNEFSLVYQPKIDSVSREVIGVEALIRWHNSVLGFVPPEKFIKIAERSGIINSIGEFVLEKSQTEIEEVWKSTTKRFLLSVNVSPKQILSVKDMQIFKNIIINSSFPKENFMIEVTENVFIGNLEKVISFLETIKEYGIGISLDDFGTGYSSLSILSKLPITELKVDKSFVHNMLLNNNNLKLVKSIINIGKDMNIKVVAEGVESKAELKVLEDYGCDIYQGYYFSKPLEKKELIKFIKNQKYKNL